MHDALRIKELRAHTADGMNNSYPDPEARSLTVRYLVCATMLLGNGVRENTPLRRSICGVRIPTAKGHSMSVLWP